MADIKLMNRCDHIVSEVIEIQGISPDYFADLTYTSNLNPAHVIIKEFSETDGLTFFDVNMDGITNWTFNTTGDRIDFGVYTVDEGMNFPDNNTAYIPPKIYSCTYTTALNECPKCGGTKQVNDITFDMTKRIPVVSGREKVSQQILKILTTLTGSHVYDIAYGSTLSDLIGKKIDPYLAAKLQQSIQDALQHQIDIHNTESLPINEQILRIASVTAKKDKQDPRTIKIEVVVTTADFSEVRSSISLRL